MDLAMSSSSRGSQGWGEEVLGVTGESCERNLGVSTPNAMGLASKVSGGSVSDEEESRSWPLVWGRRARVVCG